MYTVVAALHSGPNMSDRFIAGLLRGFAWFVVCLPTAWFAATASLLSRLGWLASRDVGLLRKNLAVVLGLPPGSPAARDLERRSVRHQIVAALETVRISCDPGLLDARAMAGFEDFERVIAEVEGFGRGQVIVTGHFGAWELLAQSTVAAASAPVCCVAKPGRSAGVTRFVERMRSQAGLRVIWSGRRSLLRDMLTCLREGQTLILVVDQRPELRRGPEVVFFGRRIEFVGGPSALAAKRDCPLVAAFCIRTGPFSYRLECEVLRRPGDPGGRVELSQRMAEAIERRIRATPEQWMWNYKRWTYEDQELAAAGFDGRPSRS